MHQCGRVSSCASADGCLFLSFEFIHPIHCNYYLSLNRCDNQSALRELDRRNVIKSDPFILMQGDVVTNVDLHEAMECHSKRKKKDAAAIMTVLLKDVGGWGLDGDGDDDREGENQENENQDEEKKDENDDVNKEARNIATTTTHGIIRNDFFLPPLRSSTDDLLVALDTTHSNRILLWDSHPLNADAALPSVFFHENSSNITVSRNYLDVGIDICSPDVLARFSDEFDYRELREQFVANCVSEEESGLQSARIYAHMLNTSSGEYAGRPLGDMRRYHQVSMDLLRRWCYPLVPDNYHHHCLNIGGDGDGGGGNGGGTSGESQIIHRKSASYVRERHFIYRDIMSSTKAAVGTELDVSTSHNRSHLGRSTQLLGPLLLGPNNSIGERCLLQRSVLGPNCTVLDDCSIVDCHLWGNVLVEEGAILEGVIICEGAIIRKGAIVERGCVVGRGCIVGEGMRLKEFTRITCAVEVNDEDDDNYSGFSGSSSSEEDSENNDEDDDDEETNSRKKSVVIDVVTNHDVVGKDGIGRVYTPAPSDDYDSDDDEEEAEAAAMELMKSQSIGYDMKLVYQKWKKIQMKDEDDGFSFDDNDDDDEDSMMYMDHEWTNGDADVPNMRCSVSNSHLGDDGMQITGRQKGVDVVKELRDICLEHETSTPVENLRIELNSFKFSQNATYADCCMGAMMAVMEKILESEGGSVPTPGKLVGSLKKMLEYWDALFTSICMGLEEEKAIIYALETMAVSPSEGKAASALMQEPAFRFVLQTLHDREIVNEEAIFAWASERKEEDKGSPLGSLFWQKPTQDFLEWLNEDESSDEGDDDSDSD